MAEESKTQRSKAPEIPKSSDIPEQLGKYLLQEEIGRGTCGVVYKAYDPFVARDVAIKLALSDTPLDPAESMQQNREFFAEAHAAGMLHHPHIVSVFDAGVDDSISYIVMEYIKGCTLAEYIQKHPQMPINQVVDVIFKCAKALDYSHKRGVLHRDIKPGNIMMSEDGSTAKIMDFSIAEMLQGDTLKPETVVGSPAFMSPEQVRRNNMGPSSDLYSLGAVMYYLLCGEPPFVAQDIRRLLEMVKNLPAPNLRTKHPELPDEVCAVVERLLSKDPTTRYQSGQDLAVELTRINTRLSQQEKQISRAESRDSLRRLRFFDDFEDHEIDEFMSASSMLSFRSGEVIIKEGDIDNAFYIVVVGSVSVSKSGKSMMTLGKGDVFGEIAFLTATRRTATVRAESEVLALKINAAAMDQVSDEVQLRYYRVFCENLIYRLSITSAKLSASQ
ncbi:MAG: protein kinase domain-containing protein [Oceanococcus sp.]